MYKCASYWHQLLSRLLITICVVLVISLGAPLKAEPENTNEIKSAAKNQSLAAQAEIDLQPSYDLITKRSYDLPELWQENVFYKVQLEQLETRLIAWAEAWSLGDANKFIGFYSQQYPNLSGRKAWLKQRQKRITPGRQIRVDVKLLEFWMDGQGFDATMVFEQAYHSKNYHDKVVKKQIWTKIQNQWHISQEIIIKQIN